MVRSIIGEVVSYYPFSSYQVKTDGANWNTRKYYSFGSTTIAMRENAITLTWLLSDQVNSTTITAAADGAFLAEIRYTSFGEQRYASGQLVTDNLYTGQRQETEIGLDYYVARFYDPVLAHFVQPDSIIPSAGSTQGFDRYAYVHNNPIINNDPTGHECVIKNSEYGTCSPNEIGFRTSGSFTSSTSPSTTISQTTTPTQPVMYTPNPLSNNLPTKPVQLKPGPTNTPTSPVTIGNPDGASYTPGPSPYYRLYHAAGSPSSWSPSGIYADANHLGTRQYFINDYTMKFDLEYVSSSRIWVLNVDESYQLTTTLDYTETITSSEIVFGLSNGSTTRINLGEIQPDNTSRNTNRIVMFTGGYPTSAEAHIYASIGDGTIMINPDPMGYFVYNFSNQWREK